jgi:glycine/sarcosine/betaine reductase complex component A
MSSMAIIEGKKLIIVGDRDGVPGPAIEECAKSAGADEILFSSTECFV